MGKTDVAAGRAVSKRGTAARVVVDELDLRLAAAQRATVVVAVVLAAVATWRPMPDPFMLPKLTVVVLAAVTLLGLAALRAVRRARVVVPVGLLGAVVAAFAVFLVLATVTADNRALALVGQHGRYSGLLSYASYLVVFLVAARTFAGSSTRGLVRALLAAGALVTAYGLVQIAGLDPWEWKVARGDEAIFSTLGNTNFSGAYIALILPVAIAVALLSDWGRGWRIGAVALALVSGVYMAATGAAQGPIAAAAGLSVVGVAWFLGRRRGTAGAARRRWSTGVRAGVGLAVLVGAVVGGLLAVRLAADVANSYTERLQFWQASLRLFADHPVLGTGLDSFRDYFPFYRPGEHAVLRGMQSTDSTHNLPLGMLAAGGLGLGLAYLAFLGLTARALVRGLRTAEGDRLLAVAAFGGLWAAFQLQSLVSVDVPALSFLHFVAAALLFASADPVRTATLRLPVSAAPRGSLLPRPGAPRRALSVAAAGLVPVLAVVALWFGSQPMRADLAAAQARGLPPQLAARAYGDAVELAPWEAEYRLLHANSLQAAKRPAPGLAALEKAAELRRGSAQLALTYARLIGQAGDQAEADRWVQIALQRDPRNPVALERAAELASDKGDDAAADEFERRAKELRQEFAVG